MAIQENMIKSKKDFKMFFNLKINFSGIEIKSGKISLENFLNVNTQIANSIDSLCSYKTHVNFAETLLDGLAIRGEIDIVFNHKSFSKSLINFQTEIESTWEGYFIYQDSKDKFILHAPDFNIVRFS